MLLSIVFSFRNEEEVIPELLSRIAKTMELVDLSYEVIFVNDDSTDNSLNLLLSLSQNDHRIKIINMSRRFGVHPCVMAGLKHSKGDAVIYMDTDLQDPPELIPQMIEKWKNGADVVNMTRTERLGESKFKMWLTKWAYRTINTFSEIDIPENTGDFKLLSRRVVNEVIKLDEYDPFMRGLVRWVGFKQETIYYRREARAKGQTHFPLIGKGPVKEFIRGIASFSVVPLYFSLALGFLASLISFAILIHVLIHKALGTNLPGWTAIMSALLFLGGTILFALGIMGIYIGRIYNELKRRPHYIIKDLFNFE